MLCRSRGHIYIWSMHLRDSYFLISPVPLLQSFNGLVFLEYLSCRPQYVHLQKSVSNTVLSVPYTLSTAGFRHQHNSDTLFLKLFDDTAVEHEEKRGTVLDLFIIKTIVEYTRGGRGSQSTPITIRSTEMEVVFNHRYPGVQPNSKLDWNSHIQAMYSKEERLD